MYFWVARAARKLPFKCVSITPSHSSSVILNSRLSRVMPATATRMSRRPSSSAERAAAASTCSRFVTRSDPIPLVVGHLEQQVVARDAGYGNQNVEAAQLLGGARRRGFHLLAIGHKIG